MRKVSFTAWMFVMGGASLVLRPARLKQYDHSIIEVTYVTPGGPVPVPRKWVTAQTMQRLAEGQKIPVRFLTHQPNQALPDGKKPDNPWGWLVVGAVLSAVAVYGLQLYRRELEGHAFLRG